jgi:hypothetical protein
MSWRSSLDVCPTADYEAAAVRVEIKRQPQEESVLYGG